MVNAAPGSSVRGGTGLSFTMKMEFQSEPSIGSADTTAASATPGSLRTRGSNSFSSATRRSWVHRGPPNDVRSVSR